MSEEIVARRYADALFQIGQERSITEQLEQELRIAKEVFQNNSTFYAFIQHPGVPMTQKKQVINGSFQGFSEEIINTLQIILERHRIRLLPFITDHFIQFVNDAKGIADAKVYSVRELTKDERKEISKVFAEKLGKKTLKIDNIIDPSVLGGIKIRVGNTIFDGTVNGKLERIERSIVSVN